MNTQPNPHLGKYDRITPVPLETLDALQESLAHWYRLKTGTRRENESYRGDCCALCQLYASGLTCLGCPVAFAGFNGCSSKAEDDSSPWEQVDNAYLSIAARGYNDRHQSPDFLAAASNMYDFLVALLPLGITPHCEQNEPETNPPRV